jgi:hypothetical protein
MTDQLPSFFGAQTLIMFTLVSQNESIPQMQTLHL